MTTNTIEVWKNKEHNDWVVENGSDFAIWPTQREAVKDARLKMWMQDEPSKWQILIARAKDNVVAYQEIVGLNRRGWRIIKRFKVSNPLKITERVLGAH